MEFGGLKVWSLHFAFWVLAWLKRLQARNRAKSSATPYNHGDFQGPTALHADFENMPELAAGKEDFNRF